jgi:hypothetical protein
MRESMQLLCTGFAIFAVGLALGVLIGVIERCWLYASIVAALIVVLVACSSCQSGGRFLGIDTPDGAVVTDLKTGKKYQYQHIDAKTAAAFMEEGIFTTTNDSKEDVP